MDFEKYQSRVDKGRKNMKRTDKDNVALAKAETELYHASEVCLSRFSLYHLDASSSRIDRGLLLAKIPRCRNTTLRTITFVHVCHLLLRRHSRFYPIFLPLLSWSRTRFLPNAIPLSMSTARKYAFLPHLQPWLRSSRLGTETIVRYRKRWRLVLRVFQTAKLSANQ